MSFQVVNFNVVQQFALWAHLLEPLFLSQLPTWCCGWLSSVLHVLSLWYLAFHPCYYC